MTRYRIIGAELDPALDDLVDRAERGDQAATQRLCKLAADSMHSDRPMHPALFGYVVGSLARVGWGTPLTHAFAPKGRVRPEITAARRRASDASLIRAVEDARQRFGLTLSKDGEPGPAFEHVAEQWGMTPAHIRNAYYRAIKRRTPQDVAVAESWSRAFARIPRKP